jgi:glutamine synthetase
VPAPSTCPAAGPGQFELALGHAPALQAADALLFSREAVAAMAAGHSMLACFLPKPFAASAASGLHCHFSLWQGGVNLLQHEPPAAAAAAGAAAVPPPGEAASGSSGGAAAGLGLSAVGEAFLAGILAHLPALMCFTTPSPNSFRRLAPHCWAGAYQCYGANNREAPLRLCATPGAPEAANCELKAFDATANPHLAAAAMIGGWGLGPETSAVAARAAWGQ